MPEVAEAASIADELENHILNKRLVGIHWEDNFKGINLENVHFNNDPVTITYVGSYGKKIIFLLSTRQLIVTSLGMSGRWQWIKGKHSKIWLDIETEGPTLTNIGGTSMEHTLANNNRNNESNPIRSLYFHQARPFGWVEILDLEPEDLVVIKVRIHYNLGQDILREPPSMKNWVQLFKGDIINGAGVGKKVQNWEIGRAILDQSIIAGIGNWMRAEILYESKINPHRIVSTLSDEDLQNIYNNTISLAKTAYDCHGLTISDYWSPEGRIGTYPRKIYKKDVDPDGYKVLNGKTKDGRTTHWVPDVQI